METRIKSIDGLRGVSILLVLLDHYFYCSGKDFLNPFWKEIINSKNGVDLFFIISGYLITSILFSKKKHEKFKLHIFWINRALKILPSYYFMLMVYYLLQKFNYIFLSSSTWISSLLLLRQFVGSGWETSHLWSLSVENIFYIFYPLLFVCFENDKIEKSYFRFILLILLIFPFVRYLFFYYTQISTLNILFRSEGLLIGCGIAIYTATSSRKIENFKIGLSFLIALLGILFFYLLHVSMSNFAIKFILLEYISLIRVVIIALLFLFVINLKKGLLFFIFTNSVLVFIGIISYSIYLWQQLFLSKNVFSYLSYNVFILIFIVSVLSYYCIERQIKKLNG